jgi:uncharacterized membrane protein YhhN
VTRITENTSYRIVGYIRIIAILLMLGLTGSYTWTYITRGWNDGPLFLSASLALVGIAFLNLLYTYLRRYSKWFHFTLFLFTAMVFGSVGDFLMAGIFYITPDPLINGIIFFGIGHVFYILGLRTRSPLLLNPRNGAPAEGAPDSPRLRIVNLVILLICFVAVSGLFYFTIFNPTQVAVSIVVLCYGLLFAAAAAFALTKWFDAVPILFKVVISAGFLLFLFSDWVIGVRAFASSDFLDSFVIGITYLAGQLFIHLSPITVVGAER